MNEPIEDGGELDEAEESECELLVARTDTTKAFESAEAIFNVVTLTIVAAVKL